MEIRTKRAYEHPSRSDGTRVLVDRMWPRGVKKADAAIDVWLKDIAPSAELRRWFGHDPDKWEEFQQRYRAELKEHAEPLKRLLALAHESRALTLVYAARDAQHNNAVALRAYLGARLR